MMSNHYTLFFSYCATQSGLQPIQPHGGAGRPIQPPGAAGRPIQPYSAAGRPIQPCRAAGRPIQPLDPVAGRPIQPLDGERPAGRFQISARIAPPLRKTTKYIKQHVSQRHGKKQT